MKISDLTDFALAGKSTFMVKISEITSYFKINKKAGKSPIWFVYASENGKDWKYMAVINSEHKYFIGDKTEFAFTSTVIKSFDFVWKLALIKKDDDRISLWHDGVCSMCGLQLTDEVSVERGIGPTCFKKIQNGK